MPPETQRGYEVGFGKTPAHSRFKKGRSGNLAFFSPFASLGFRSVNSTSVTSTADRLKSSIYQKAD
jgi:hypothetical protein